MNRGRPRLEPLEPDRVNERLAYVLAERPPRRARRRDPDDPADPDEARSTSVRAEFGTAPGEERTVPPGARTQEHATAPPEPDVLDHLPWTGSTSVVSALRSFTLTHLKVVAVLVTVGLVITGWELLRARPVAIAEPAVLVASSATSSAHSTPGRSTPGPGPTPSAVLVVHVLGAVRKPGLVELPDRSRVQDALDAAGGLTAKADPGELNLAQPLTDGEQIVIGSRKRPVGEVRTGSTGGPTGGPTGVEGANAPGAAVDLNRATSAQLETLPGVGPVTAGKIVAWRTEHQRFSSVEELQEVDGIGPKTFAQVAPHVRV